MVTDSRISLRDKDFRILSTFIEDNFGIKMPASKKTMLESRLQSRLKATFSPNFKDYIKYLLSESGQKEEIIPLMDVVTTNKTDFFREAAHFDFLEKSYLPGVSESKPLRIWSAACSTGEEPYSLAMCIEEFKSKYRRMLPYSITATDLSLQVLRHASRAIYQKERIARIPDDIVRKYFLKNRDTKEPLVRLKPEIRKKVIFKPLNLMEDHYPLPENFDLIFCRNVLIYFKKSTQEAIINKLCTHLSSGGLFFLGHSESIISMDVPLKPLFPTVYEKI